MNHHPLYIPYSQIRAWLHVGTGDFLEGKEVDDRVIETHTLACEWLKADQLLDTTEPETPTVDVQAVSNMLESSGTQSYKLHWVSLIFKSVPEALRDCFDYTPFESYHQLLTYLETKLMLASTAKTGVPPIMNSQNAVLPNIEQGREGDIVNANPRLPEGREHWINPKFPLTDQQSRLICYLGIDLAEETYIRWKDIYLREDLFEGRKVGEIFAEIGGKELSHTKRIRKIRHYQDSMLTWRTPNEVVQIKADALRRTMLSKKRKRLESLDKLPLIDP